MITRTVFVLFSLLLLSSVIVKSSHFNGGTITWAPVDPAVNSSTVVVTITQTYFWILSKIDCKPNVPITTAGRENQSWPLACVANCSTDGGYSTNPINTLTDCISSNPSVDTMKSQTSKNVTLASGSYFSIAHKDGTWRPVQNSAQGNWSIVTYIDLRRRLDGIINTSPMTTIQSPQYVFPNRTMHIRIPVHDVNQGDDLRCRWATNPGLNGVDECSGLCNSNQLPNGTNLTDCVLTFTATTENTWYGFTLQIEDFFNTTSKFPMSSVPVQFLIYVLANVTCSQEPVILPLTGCLEVQIGVTTNYTLFVMNYCNRTKVQIIDVSPTMNIPGMNISQIFNSTTNSSLSYVNLQWTPQMNQIGFQQFCAMAYNSENIQSVQYCVTFIVKNVTNFCMTTTTTKTTIPNNMNIPLIIGLSILALLVGLCCCCCCLLLYYCLATKRRKHRQRKDQFPSQVFAFSTERLTKIKDNLPGKSFIEKKRKKLQSIYLLNSDSMIINHRKTNDLHSSSASFQTAKRENDSAEGTTIFNIPRSNTLTDSIILKKHRANFRPFSNVSVKRIRIDRSIHPKTISSANSNPSLLDHND